jgi:hypothetical protein
MRYAYGFTALLLCVGLVFAEEAQKETENVGISKEEAKDGFENLFDGKTLDGWQGDVEHYAVVDGTMVCHGQNLFTKKEYANFILRFEFKLPPAGNNGVGIRAPLEGSPSYAGMEIQILDEDHPKYKNIQPYQVHGSIYGLVPAKRGFLKPVGQWNKEEIMADGPHIQVTLNGIVIVDADLTKIKEPLDHQSHPGLHSKKGRIAWLGHGKPADPIAFRNVRIKELPEKKE